MTFEEMIDDDMKEVFFDIEEFSLSITHQYKNGEEMLKVIFDTSSELILDNATEFGESIATVPSILLKEADTKNISHSSIFIIEDEQYKMTYKNREDTELTRIYLEKRR